MKINKRTSYRNYILVALAILTIAAVAAYLFFFQNGSNQSVDKNSEASTAKDQPVVAEDKETTPNTDKAPAPEDNTASEISLTASARQVDATIYLRGGANILLPAEGTCYALLKNASNQTIRKDTELLNSASTTDCKTIAIQASDLATGSWTYTLYYESSTIKGVSQDVTFEVN